MKSGSLFLGYRTVKKYTTFSYDDELRLHKTTYPGNAYEERLYDDAGNLWKKIDPNSNAVEFSYDALNRLESVIQPGTIVTEYEYDEHDNLVSVTDAEDHTTSFVFDDFGRQLQETSPDTGTTGFSYDPANNLIQRSDALSQTTDFDYDKINRLTDVDAPVSADDIDYTYDTGTYGVGKLTGIDDPSGSQTLTYDVFGRLVSEEKTILNVDYTTDYSYSGTGQIDQITYPSGRVIDYTLNSDERVTSVVSTMSGTVRNVATSISYLPFGPVKGLTYGNSMTLTQTFDQLYRIASIVAGSVYSVSYTKDSAGNITDITNSLDSSRTQSFDYDSMHRLTDADGIYGTIEYTYDDVGNRLTRTQDSQSDSYSYATGTNRLTSITGSNPLSYSFDSNGNVTTRGSLTLDYNYNNRFVEVSDAGGTIATYTYNANNQRIIKNVDEVVTVFHYDQYGNMIGESDELGNFDRDYVYAKMMRLAMFDFGLSPEAVFYVNDHLGTPQKMVNTSGTVIWNADYEPFGKIDVLTATVENNHRFPGQYGDIELGLSYNWHRYYDEKSGRYLRSDPIGLAGGINSYAYVQNNPVNWMDSWGLLKLGGNYIGPNYSAGQEKSWEDTSPNERATNPPTGRLDEGALIHDKGYSDCRSQFKCNNDKSDFKKCQNKCDRNLRKHNSQLSNKTIEESIGGTLINTGIFIQEGFRTPSINPNSNEPGTIFKINF